MTAISQETSTSEGMAAKPVLQAVNIVKTYGHVVALDGVDLELYPGEVLAVIGDNGAGKSTLIKCLSGAEAPNEGQILLDGQPVLFKTPLDARNHGIETVYQTLAVAPSLDIAGNLFLGREPRRSLLGLSLLDKRRMHAAAGTMLGKLGIVIPDTRLKVETLSGGQRQSIAIGRAASFDPAVLIMDEPTAALAVAEVEAVLELIRTVSARGVSVILITHRLQDLFLVCDRIQVMYEGRNVAERRIEETNIEEVVNLIVGRKFAARSAGRAEIAGAPL